jgi:hypothetical protein
MKGKCINCETEFEYFTSQKNGKYCSNKCQGEYKIKQRFIVGMKWINRMSIYLKKIRGEKCEECGITEWNKKPITFHVDHINGDRSDNRYENLKIICPNCHSLTETFGIKNMSEEGRIKCVEAANKTNNGRWNKKK